MDAAHLSVFASVLGRTQTPEIALWDADAYARAVGWGAYFEKLVEKVRLTIDNPTGTMKRGADDDVLQYYEQSALKGSVDAQVTLANDSWSAPGSWIDADMLAVGCNDNPIPKTPCAYGTPLTVVEAEKPAETPPE